MTIEIIAPVALAHPTPVAVPVAELPEYPVLRPENGGALLAGQADNGQLLFIAPPMAAGESARFRVEAGEASPGVVLMAGEETIELQLPSGALGTYRFGSAAPRPYIWPLLGPGGREVTRAFPMENRAGEMHDHPHHRSLWTAFDEVSGANNWHEAEKMGRTLHEGFFGWSSGPVCGGFVAVNRWVSEDGAPLLRETRSVRLYNIDGDFRMIDYGIQWSAAFGPVTFGDTKEAGSLAVRVATSMDGARGGVIVNSEGGTGEKECWGKPAAWCDYSGAVQIEDASETQGIALLSHPRSHGGAPRWHVRDYGLFAANPFSTGAFTGGDKTPFTLPDGPRPSAGFLYRVILHRGDAAAANIAAHWQAFSSPPAVRVV